MSDTIFKLLGEITVNGLGTVKTGLADVEGQFAKAEKAVFKFGRQCTSIGTTLSKDITAPLVALGAAVALTANKTIEFADKLTNLETVTGLSSKSLQEFKYIAEMTDTNFDGFVGTISKFTNKMAGIVSEGGKPYETLKKLGVGIMDSNGHIRDMNELFPETIKALQNIENPIERNQAAMQIFGKSVSDLAPILSLSNGQFDGMRKKANDLGLVMSDDDVKAANAFGDEIKNLKVQLSALVNNLGVSLIPILRDTILPLIQQNIVPAIKSFAGKIKDLADWYNKLTPAMQGVILGFATLIGSLGPALLIFGKTITIFKSLEATILLTRTAMLALSVSMATNPFGIALIGAAAFAGVLATIIALEDKRKKLSSQETKDAGINKELQDFIKLKNEQETIIKMGEGSNFKVYSKESVDQAKANLETIKAEIIKFNTENGISPTANAPTAPAKIDGKIDTGDKNEDETKYIQLLQEQGKTELQLLEVKKAEALEDAKKITNAEKRESEINAIEKYYSNARQSIIDKQQDDYAEAKDRESEKEKETADKKNEITQAWADKVAEQTMSITDTIEYNYTKDLAACTDNEEAKAKVEEYYRNVREKQETIKLADTKKALLDNVKSWLGALQTLTNGVSSLVSQYYSNKSTELENWYTIQTEAITNSSDSETSKTKKQEALDKEYSAKKRKLKQEEGKAEKAAAIISAIINTAVAVTNALPNLVLAALVGVLGAAQIALIAAQPIALAKGAFVKSHAGGSLAQIGEGSDDEVVLPVQTGIRSLTDGIMSRMGSAVSLLSPQSAYSLAGAGAGYSNSSSTSSATNLNVGVLVADKAGLKELTRQLAPIQTAEQQRRSG